MRVIILIVSVLVLAQCSVDIRDKIIHNFMSGPKKDLFKVYHHLYEKTYDLDSEEGVRRYRIFKEKVREIQETNAKDLPYKLGVNQFSDLSKEEFREQYLMDPEIKRRQSERFLSEPGYFDKFADGEESEVNQLREKYRGEGFTALNWGKYFNPARAQMSCGSCWAFSTAGAFEAILQIKSNKPQEYLSTQQMVDCDTKNQGCYGGDIWKASNYLSMYGLTTEKEYPYKAVQGDCQPFNTKTTRKAEFQYCSNLRFKDDICDDEWQASMLKEGPLIVGVDGEAIKDNQSGIFTGPCYHNNHAIILVGYGVDNKHGPYFILRNSWGDRWGETYVGDSTAKSNRGYIRVAYNKSNRNSCFIGDEAYLLYPKK